MGVIEPPYRTGRFARQEKEEFARALYAAVPSARVTLGLIVINAAISVASLLGVPEAAASRVPDYVTVRRSTDGATSVGWRSCSARIAPFRRQCWAWR